MGSIEFLPKPDLTHYTGRRVTSVELNDPDEPWNWSIVLDGSVRINNRDKRRTAMPTSLVGRAMLFVMFSETDTRIRFGNQSQEGHAVNTSEITLSPTQYSLSDPNFHTTDEIFPQQRDPEETVMLQRALGLPEDPSLHRIVEMPDDKEKGY